MKRSVLNTVCVLLLLSAGTVSARAETPAGATLIRAIDNKIFAQVLVNELMTANPDLMGAGLHAIPPNGTGYVIVAQMRDIIGTKSSEDDLEIIKQDATRIYPDMLNGQPRMKALAPLRDRHGQIIGLAALSFKRGPDTSKLAVHARLDAILQELAARIPDRAALFSPIP